MNMHNRDGLDAYYADAASWNVDRVETMRGSRRVAWGVAGVAAAIALLEAIALVVLMPLKTVEPYTLLVDKTTGYVQALKPLDQTKIAPDAALTQSFLVQFVIAREGFDIATLNANYRKVALFSADKARSNYLRAMQASNPESPLLIYPRTTVVDVRVKSVSPIGPNTVLVRYDTVRSDAGAQPRLQSSYVAVIRYRYSTAAMKLEDRFVNPLGFQVIGYRKDPEVLPAATPGSASAALAPATSYYSPPPAAPQQFGAAR